MSQIENRKILIIDDNKPIHDDFKKILSGRESSNALKQTAAAFFDAPEIAGAESLDFEIDSAFQGKDGLELVKQSLQQKSPYSMAFVDMRMPPGWDGLRTIEEIWRVDPELLIVISSAYSDNTWQEICERLGQTDKLLILKKPFDNVEVAQLAIALCEKWSLARKAELNLAQLETLVEERTAELLESDRKLATRSKHLELAVSIAHMGHWRLDLESGELSWPDETKSIFDGQPEQHVKDRFRVAQMHHPDDRERVQNLLNTALTDNETICYKARVLRNDGELRYVKTNAVCELDSAGQPIAMFGVTQDITDYEQALQAVQHAALHDPLTGLFNRSKFHEQLEQTLTQVRQREGIETALVILDMDHFKQVNDTLGHPVGDKLLIEIAQRLRGCFRQTDLVARLGGDEFAIVLAEVKSKLDLEKIVGDMWSRLAKPITILGHTVNPGFSAGIAISSEENNDPDSILRNADFALYQAKHEGRNNFLIYDSKLSSKIKARREMELDLADALPLDQFEVFYQPILDLSSGKIRRFEAMVRWHHPRQGLLEASEFIDIASENGLIIPIGNWVIRQACEAGKRLSHETGIVVNVCNKQLEYCDFDRDCAEILAKTQFPASRLQLEIKESKFLEMDEASLQCIERISNLGIGFSLDNFGTEQSVISRLKPFQFNRLKVNQSVFESSDENQQTTPSCKLLRRFAIVST